MSRPRDDRARSALLSVGTSQRLRQVATKLLLVVATMAVCVLGLELACRVVYSVKLDYQIEMCRYAALMKAPPTQSPALSHVHVPNVEANLMGVEVRLNSHGFRGPEIEIEKPDNVFRVLLLGDSLTLGWGAREEEIFASRIEASLAPVVFGLDRGFTAVEVVNTGVGNYNTVQEVAMYEFLGRRFRPDLVLLNYFINDAEPVPARRTSPLLKHSYLAMWAWGRLNTLALMAGSGKAYDDYYRDLYRDDMPGWEAARAAFGALARSTTGDGIPLQMFLLPELHAVGPDYAFAEVHRLVADAARKHGIVRVTDLAERFSRETPVDLWVSLDDAHPNARGHRIIAEGITQALAAGVFGEGKVEESDGNPR